MTILFVTCGFCDEAVVNSDVKVRISYQHAYYPHSGSHTLHKMTRSLSTCAAEVSSHGDVNASSGEDSFPSPTLHLYSAIWFTPHQRSAHGEFLFPVLQLPMKGSLSLFRSLAEEAPLHASPGREPSFPRMLLRRTGCYGNRGTR